MGASSKKKKKNVAESSLLFKTMGFLANKPIVAGDSYSWNAPNQDVPSQCEIAYVIQTTGIYKFTGYDILENIL